jgi:hypothetical protein
MLPGVGDGFRTSADEVGHQRWQAIILAIRGNAFHGHIARPCNNKSHHWQAGLLRPRRERPHRRAAQPRNELASSHPWSPR